MSTTADVAGHAAAAAAAAAAADNDDDDDDGTECPVTWAGWSLGDWLLTSSCGRVMASVLALSEI